MRGKNYTLFNKTLPTNMFDKRKFIPFFLIIFLISCTGSEEKLSDKFVVPEIAEVEKVEIVKDGVTVLLNKGEQRQWFFNEIYPLEKRAQKQLFQNLEGLKVIAPPVTDSLGKKYADNMKKNPYRITCFNKDKEPIISYYIGDYNSEIGATYLMRTDEQAVYPVHIPGMENNLHKRFPTDVGYWTEALLFSYVPNQISTVSVDYVKNPEESFILTIKDKQAQWVSRQTGAELADLSLRQVGSYLSYFMRVRFLSVLPDNELSKSLFSNDLHLYTIRLKETNGNIKKVDFYAVKDTLNHTLHPDNLNAMVDDSQLISLSYAAVDLLLKKKDYFRNKQE